MLSTGTPRPLQRHNHGGAVTVERRRPYQYTLSNANGRIDTELQEAELLEARVGDPDGWICILEAGLQDFASVRQVAFHANMESQDLAKPLETLRSLF